MLDVAPTELLLVAAVAVIVIGPKDLPKAMRVAGHWVGRARGVARQFRQGFDDMVREAEFKEMEQKWAEENARIMREFPSTTMTATALPAPPGEIGSTMPDQNPDLPPATAPPPELHDDPPSGEQIEHPVVEPPGPRAAGPPGAAKAPS